MKIGFSTWAMPEMSIDEALMSLAEIGYDGVEPTVIRPWSTELDTLHAAERLRIRELFDRYGLELPAVAGHASLLSPQAQAHADNWRRLTGAVDLCVEWAGSAGPAALDTTLGSGPESWKNRTFVLERLNALVAYCAERDVVLALEPYVGDGLEDPGQVVELLTEVDSPYCKLNFDISHFDVQGFTTAETVAALGPHTVHTHVKDQRGRVPDFDFMIPGEGDFDYVEYLQEMKKAGYNGYISAEISMQVHRRPGYDPLAAAEMTYRTLTRAFEEAGIDRG